MRNIQSPLAMLCVLLMIKPPAYAQQPAAPDTTRLQQQTTRGPEPAPEGPWYSSMQRPYQARNVPQINLTNSGPLDSLIRAGRLYLSLSDAIALALENNLDVEILRYEFPLANADLLRAQAGSGILGVPTAVLPGVPNGGSQIVGSTNTGILASGATSPLAPNQSFDPLFGSLFNFGHTTAPQSNTIVAGTPALVTTNQTYNFNISQTFKTGGTATLTYNNLAQHQNSFRNTINPFTTSFLDLTITQPLLQGFGFALNNRTIRIAKNNLRAADYVFRQQITNTVANVVQLYWNLVAATSAVGVQQQAVEVSQKLYEDNQKQVEIGTLAPIETVRAQAQLAQNQQALVASRAVVRQLETVLKSALSRNGLASPSVMDATIVPTDRIRVPDQETVEPIQDLMSKAIDNRPDLLQSRIQIENSEIALQGTKNALLPQLNLVGDLRNNGLAGAQNTIIGPPLGSTGIPQNPPIADPFFVGGYSSVVDQIFSRNFPTYSIGLSLNITLRNRSAQANMVTASLNLRQNQLQIQRQMNQIRVDVQNALIALENARAQYQAAVQQRILQEQTLDADQKKLALGATTVYQVIQDQRDLTTASSSEVSAQAQYMQARVQIDIATGQVLQANNVVFDEAKAGVVARGPNPLPPPGQSR